MGKRGREDPCPICLHYHDYEGGEVCSECGHQKKDVHLQCYENTLPFLVLDRFLYLGSYHHAAAMDTMRFIGVEHFLSLAPQQPELFQQSFDYCTVASTPPDLRECFDFIDNVRLAGGKVLVYDMTCRGAAPYVVMAYLVREGKQLASVMRQMRDVTAFKIDRQYFDELACIESSISGTNSLTWEQAQGIASNR